MWMQVMTNYTTQSDKHPKIFLFVFISRVLDLALSTSLVNWVCVHTLEHFICVQVCEFPSHQLEKWFCGGKAGKKWGHSTDIYKKQHFCFALSAGLMAAALDFVFSDSFWGLLSLDCLYKVSRVGLIGHCFNPPTPPDPPSRCGNGALVRVLRRRSSERRPVEKYSRKYVREGRKCRTCFIPGREKPSDRRRFAFRLLSWIVCIKAVNRRARATLFKVVLSCFFFKKRDPVGDNFCTNPFCIETAAA